MPLVSNMSEIISREVVLCNHCDCSSVVITLDVESCLWWLEDISDTLGRFYGLLTRGNKVLIVPYLDLIWFHFPTSDHVNYFYWSPHRQHRAGECTDEPSLGIMMALSMMCWDKHCSHDTCIFTHWWMSHGIELWQIRLDRSQSSNQFGRWEGSPVETARSGPADGEQFI